MYKTLLIYCFTGLFTLGCGSSSEERRYNNGDLTATFDSTQNLTPAASTSDLPIPEATASVRPLTPEQQYNQQKQALLESGWESKLMADGQMPRCYNFKPRSNKDIDNKLEVTVGGGTDVVIKVMDKNTDRCVRYVYINSGSTYEIRHVPEGVYYLKIAYGRDWLSRVDQGECIGKFLSNSLYSRGEDEMDFRIQRSETGYSIPSFSLKLDVVSNDLSNSFSSSGITEDEFNQ